jgi:hypothetical protein
MSADRDAAEWSAELAEPGSLIRWALHAAIDLARVYSESRLKDDQMVLASIQGSVGVGRNARR